MTHFLVLILVGAGVGAYFMTPDERTRVLRAVLAALHKAKDTVALEGLHGDPFFDALRARNARAIATPVLVVLGIAVFARAGILDLLVSAACLWQIGLILERLVGRLAFCILYVACAAAAVIVSLASLPHGMNVAGSAPVLGMYGVLLVTSIWTTLQRSSLAIPPKVVERLGPVAAVFVLYKLATAGPGNAADAAALICGLGGGAVVARDVAVRTPQIRRLVTVMATLVAVVTLYALVTVQRPASEVTDVRPEIERVIALEIRTAGLYEKEVDRFRKGRMKADALADVIEKTIVPDLQAAAGRLRALQDVAPEHQPLVVAAQTFLKVRHESWRLRAAALHKSDMQGLRKADRQEQVSREAFHRLTSPPPHDGVDQPAS